VALILKGLALTQTSRHRPLSYGGDFEPRFSKKEPPPGGIHGTGEANKSNCRLEENNDGLIVAHVS
jgi:hypothetical protein